MLRCISLETKYEGGTVQMVKVQYIDLNPVDALTKVVVITKFRTCLDIAGLCNL